MVRGLEHYLFIQFLLGGLEWGVESGGVGGCVSDAAAKMGNQKICPSVVGSESLKLSVLQAARVEDGFFNRVVLTKNTFFFIYLSR